MDPRRLVLYYLVMTLFLAALAAGAYTGLREVSDEAEAVNRRLELVVLVDPVQDELRLLSEFDSARRAAAAGMRAEPIRAATARLRDATAVGPLAAEGRNLAALAEAVLATPADDAVLAEALGAARVLGKNVVREARVALRDGADRPASERARWILYGSIGAAFLGSLAFTVLMVRSLRERRAASTMRAMPRT